jgi:hypothetical protein
MSTLFLVISAVAQCFVVKFLANENVKLANILSRLRAQFGDETLKEPRDMTRVSQTEQSLKKMRRVHLLQIKLWPESFGTLMASYSTIF